MTDRFLRACRLEPVDATPVWFMRQAGRYMSDYRALRERYSLLEICRQPDLAVAVTLQPVEVIEVDAAILFSDLLLPFTPLGLDFDFVKGEGPAVENPIRSAADVERLRTFDPRVELGHVLETIRILRHELEGRVPLIGFGGAPFTLAAYAIEGGPSTTYMRTKTFMYAHPRAWHRLCDRFATLIADYMRAQIEAGAQAIQIFDSWAGALSRSDYREFAFPHTRHIFERLADTGVPTDSFRRRHHGDPAGPGGRRGRRDRGRLAAAPGRSVGADRARPRRSRAIWIRRSCSDPATACSVPHTTCSGGRMAGRGTFSIWATGCCRAHRSSGSRSSRATCIARRRADAVS